MWFDLWHSFIYQLLAVRTKSFAGLEIYSPTVPNPISLKLEVAEDNSRDGPTAVYP